MPTDRISSMSSPNARRGDNPYFRHLMECLPIAAYACDCDGRITYWNEPAQILWGGTPAGGNTERYCGPVTIAGLDGGAISGDRCWTARAIETSSAIVGEHVLLHRANGETIRVHASANPLRDDGGVTCGAISVLVELSDVKRVPSAGGAGTTPPTLESVAHDLRDPLGPIGAAVELLRDGSLDPAQATWALDVIERQVLELTRRLDRLLLPPGSSGCP